MALRTLLSAMATNVACFQPTNFDVRHCVGVVVALGTFVGSKARTRHFDRWIHFGREQYIDNFSTPKWIPTAIQVADIFTKPLDKTTFLKFRAALLNTTHDAYTETMRKLIA
eukprot:2229217-Prymnesium_polylepis.1